MNTREGFKSPKWGHLGVYYLCTGPGGPRPGPRVQAVIYNTENCVVRRLEHILGTCIDPGYVDFFNSYRCRPSVHLRPVIDIAPDGRTTTLLPDFHSNMGRELFDHIFEAWATTHGIPETGP